MTHNQCRGAPSDEGDGGRELRRPTAVRDRQVLRLQGQCRAVPRSRRQSHLRSLRRPRSLPQRSPQPGASTISRRPRGSQRGRDPPRTRLANLRVGTSGRASTVRATNMAAYDGRNQHDRATTLRRRGRNRPLGLQFVCNRCQFYSPQIWTLRVELAVVNGRSRCDSRTTDSRSIS